MCVLWTNQALVLSASELGNPEGRAGLPLGLGKRLGTHRVGGRPAGRQVSGEAADRICPPSLLRPHESLGWAPSHLPSHSRPSSWWRAPALAPSLCLSLPPHSHRTC